jgi:DNA-binding transcriptional ArsR family regulator
MDVDGLLRFFKALGNDSRLKLLGLTARRPHAVQELAALLELSEPTVSHHLSLLKSLGLVSMRQDGNTRWFTFQPAVLTDMMRSLNAPEQIASLAEGVSADAWDAGVLDNFLAADGSLKSVPASRKKRRVILAWLARQFEEGRRYPESEVNALLQRRHWDSATLRRELIGYKMLARESGRYWRLPESSWQPA